MNQTHSKCKLRVVGALASLLIGSLAVGTATAQTAVTGVNPGPSQSTEQLSNQPPANENTTSQQQAHPAQVQNRIPTTHPGKYGILPQGTTTPATATSKQSTAPAVGLEQLKYLRKQAIQEGQSTEAIDKAIQQIITNQAN